MLNIRNLKSSGMVDIYVDLIRAGKMTIDDVPEYWREDVRKALEGNNNEEVN